MGQAYLSALVGIVDECVGPDGEKIAIKMENTSKRISRPTLAREYNIY
jgi:hypothetical protein